MEVATILTSLGPISESISNILTSGDKVQIAKYQAEGKQAEIDSLIAQKQAILDAQAEQNKLKSNNTIYIVLAFIALVIIVLLAFLLTKKDKGSSLQQPNYQYQPLQKPTMPTNYVQSAPPPRQLQPIAPKA